MANQSSRTDQKKLGFKLIPGASRLAMIKNGVKKGVFLPKKGQTNTDFIRERNKDFDKLIDEDRREFEFSSGNSSLAISKLSRTKSILLLTNFIQGFSAATFSNIKFGEADKNSNTVIENFDVRTPGNETLALALSGGNQQKFVVGREIENKPQLLIASQPTRGIDIGAQSLIWNKLRLARDHGLGVLLISADLDELIGLSDRLYVIYEGNLVKELDPENATPEILGSYMTGIKS